MDTTNIGTPDCLFDSLETEGTPRRVYFVSDRRNGDLCYKDGAELPPLDFNRNCFTNGWCVIFYTEMFRKNYPVGYETESVLTEMCEVTVTGTVFIRVPSNSL